MATTNFVQHNPTAANQEPDATFDSDSLTTGGIGTDAIMPSKWMNKRWYQDSTFIAAFAQMLTAKGYSTSDANVSTLAAVLANVLTNADTKPNQIQVPFSPTPTFDCSLANGFRIDLAGNVTSSSLINQIAGQVYTFYIVSASPGNYSFAWPGNVNNPPNVQTQSVGNLLTYQFISDGNNLYPLSTMLELLLSTKQNVLGFTPVQQGGGAGQAANKIYIGWDGVGLKAQVDNTDLGRILFASIFSGSLSANGWIAIPIGGQTFILQWAQGFVMTSSGTVTQVINFPINFPNTCLQVLPGDFWTASADNDIMAWQVTAFNDSNVSLRRARRGDEGNYSSAPIIFAVGF